MKRLAILGIFALVMLLVLPGAVSAADVQVSGSVVDEDLAVTAISPNEGAGGYMFANEPNVISVTVMNNGGLDAAASTVEVVVGSATYTAAVGALATGASETVTVTDTVSHTYSEGTVTVTANADSDDVIDESDETNNAMTSDLTIYYNGYKGKRYTDGSDIVTYETFSLRGDVLYSTGDSYYLSAYDYPTWTTYDVTWTSSDLVIPDDATISEVRLYVPFTWDKGPVFPDQTNLAFNGQTVAYDAYYADEKQFGSSYPYGMTVYDVTSQFDADGNSATLSNNYAGGGQVSIRGMVLLVIYADSSETLKQIIVNEEFDVLYGGSSYSTTPEEATAYAPFGALDTSDVNSATLITMAPGAGPNEGDMLYNGAVIATDVWNYAGSSQIGIDSRDVTSYLSISANEIGFQSSGDWMEASNAILILEQTEPAPDVTFTGTPLSGTEPLEVTFDATNTGGLVSSWSWEYSTDGGTTWTEFATEEDPTYSFNEGVYDIRVTATGAGGSDTSTESSYISVGEATIIINVSPESIDFGAMAAGETVSDSTGVTVTVDGGNSWYVDASATNGGYMMADITSLANLFQLSNDGTTFQSMDLDFSDFLTGSAGTGGSGTAYVQQLIDAADAPGAYSIKLTFTGGFV